MNSAFEALKTAWREAFTGDTLPSDGTFRAWCDRFDAPALHLAFRETVRKGRQLGNEMDSLYRAKFFTSCASRVKLAELERQMGTQAYRVFDLVSQRFAGSKGTDQDCKACLDVLTILVEHGPEAAMEAYWDDPTHPTRIQAEDMLRRLGPDISWAQMVEAAKPAINTHEA